MGSHATPVRVPDGTATDGPATDGPATDGPATDRALVGTRRGALHRVEFVARLLDDAVRVPGTDFRVGLDPTLGLLPVVGDAAGGVVSLYVVLEAANAGVPKRTLAKMLGVVAVDTVGGSVPFVGTVFDAAWKANARNVETLRRHAEERD